MRDFPGQHSNRSRHASSRTGQVAALPPEWFAQKRSRVDALPRVSLELASASGVLLLRESSRLARTSRKLTLLCVVASRACLPCSECSLSRGWIEGQEALGELVAPMELGCAREYQESPVKQLCHGETLIVSPKRQQLRRLGRLLGPRGLKLRGLSPDHEIDRFYEKVFIQSLRILGKQGPTRGSGTGKSAE